MRERTVKKPRTRSPHQRAARLTVFAIGHDGWPVAERPLDFVDPMIVESAAEELRAAVRNDTGWAPRIVIVDWHGHDVTSRFRVE
jgi:hypothetical protein